MPIFNKNSDFDASDTEEELSPFGFREVDEDEEALLEEEKELEPGSEKEFDLDEGAGETVFAAPQFAGRQYAAPETEEEAGELLSDNEAEDLELEEEEDEDDLVEEEEEGLPEEEINGEESDDDCVVISKNKIILAKQLLENIQESNEKLIQLFGALISDSDEERIAIAQAGDGFEEREEGVNKIVEGVFDGQNMIGPDGKEYSVPPNYASKSKLVEGDMLKLTITDRGTFVYKQTKPVERRRLIGRLEKDEDGNYLVVGEHKKWHVLTASITYFKGAPGDKAVILLPQAGDSQWGAVENVIRGK